MDRVKDKVIIVTGGGRGIGQAACELLAAEGAKLIVTGRTLEPLQATVSSIQSAGGEAIAVQHNVANEAEWDTVFKTAQSEFGAVDVLVNNAGIVMADECKDIAMPDWQQVMDINVTGVFLGIQGAIRAMLASNKAGSIINLTSIFGRVGGGAVSYSASKGAVAALTRSVAVECGRLGYSIRVNSICPGAIDTPMDFKQSLDETKTIETDTEKTERRAKAMKDFINHIPMQGRIGLPLELANGILFLASDESSYMTGSELVIDGGYTVA